MRRELTLEIDLPHGPAAVWRALTDPAALSEWLMPVHDIHDFALTVGHRFQLCAQPMPGWDGLIDCRILQAEEPYRLSYSWNASRMRSGTTVRWTVTILAGGGTRLSLDQVGFEGLSGAILAFMHRGGWKKFLTIKLPSYLAANPSPRRIA